MKHRHPFLCLWCDSCFESAYDGHDCPAFVGEVDILPRRRGRPVTAAEVERVLRDVLLLPPKWRRR